MRYALPVVIIVLLLLTGTVLFVYEKSPAPSRSMQNDSYRVVNAYPHDRYAFTEGLAYHDGRFIESTGPQGNSTIRLVNLTTGCVITEHHLPSPIFAEGATVFGNRIAQETETSGYGILYDVSNLKLLGTFNYSTKGWGITYDGKYLIMSDGTSTLFFLDPETFRPVRNIPVTANGVPVKNINELEFVNGEVYANIWPTYTIARISPDNGQVTGWIDLAGIMSPEDEKQIGWSSIRNLWGDTSIPFRQEACANGIAYDTGGNRLFVTGKLWPKVYEIQLVPESRT
jgi:glutaminyl-peptide cyclotransferase